MLILIQILYLKKKLIHIHRCNIFLDDIIKLTVVGAIKGYYLRRLFEGIKLNNERQNRL